MSKVTRITFGKGRKRAAPPPPPPPDKMTDLFKMSLDVVEEELSAGSPRMAQWFIDSYLKHESKRLRTRLELTIDTPRDLEAASKEVVLAAANGIITFDECKELQDALARHAVLSGIREIDEMRERITAMSEKAKSKRMGANGHTPTWGRLSEGRGK